jgi:hypothetical protein
VTRKQQGIAAGASPPFPSPYDPIGKILWVQAQELAFAQRTQGTAEGNAAAQRAGLLGEALASLKFRLEVCEELVEQEVAAARALAGILPVRWCSNGQGLRVVPQGTTSDA